MDRNPVVAGQPFRITFEFKDARVDFRPPPAIDGIRLLNGPSTSTSTQIVNGSMSSTRSYTYTAGGQARTDPDSQFVLSLPGRNPENASYRLARGEARSRRHGRQTAVLSGDRRDKRKVHLGEPIRVQYRIYNRLDGVDVRSYTFPDLTGVWKETVDGEDPRWENTVQNGQRFQVATIRTDILYPTRTGELVLEGFDVDAQARISFFNTRPLAASAPAVKVEVLPLPDSPGAPSLGSFNGLSLRWTAEGQNPRKANEAVNLKLEFNGEGNLALLGAPDIAWPADLEVFDPDIQDRIRTTVEGQRGKRTFTFLVIPRAEGVFEIELPRLAYFDFAQDRFRTLSAPRTGRRQCARRQSSFGFNSGSDVTILTGTCGSSGPKPNCVRRAAASMEVRCTCCFVPPRFPRPRPAASAHSGRTRSAASPPESGPTSAAENRAHCPARSVRPDALGPAVHAFLQAELDLTQSESDRAAYEERLTLGFPGGPASGHCRCLGPGPLCTGRTEAEDLAGRIEAAMDALS